jgi:phage baseplate assembly protein W
MAKVQNTSLDLDINFDRNPLSGDVAVRRDEEAIKRSLKNLILLKRNEKPFHPEIYSGIQDMLFELVDPLTVIEVKKRISDTIRNYEPRVNTAVVDVADVIDRNEIRITIHFTIKNVQRVFSTTVAVTRLR